MSNATQFEADYSELSADITAKIGRIPSLFGKDKHDMVGEVEGLLEEAKDLIDQIEVESHAATGDQRRQITMNVVNYKRDYETHVKNLRKARLSYTDESEQRNELLGNEHKNTMTNNSEKLERSSKRLEDGYRMAMETEEIGQNVLNNLAQDREKINNARNRLNNVDSTLTQSSRLLNNMYRRVIQNKAMMFVIGLIIVVIIVLALYGMFK
ncbi:vesicle transport through interaction with t-SNAREs homolog 1A-like [Bolinopsis microptera]|uniref:vesicle transport through interaction with t-SNAREs homolog 1A-like n=2 Tax=Bolinopsis microptera TaxID=2820187 RepID=UPI00307A1070